MEWKQPKQYVKYLCFSLFLSASLILSPMSLIGSLASTTSGTSTTLYNYTTIYPNNQLNQNVIDKFNSMTAEEKSQLLPMIAPMFFKSLGIFTSNAYDTMNTWYNTSLQAFKALYPEASDLQDSNEGYSIKKAYTYYTRESGRYFYYENFDDFLSRNVQAVDGVLVLNDTETIYSIYDDVIQNEREENGVINVTLKSYTNINSSNFGNLSQYSDFIRLCKEHRSVGFVVVAKSPSSENSIVVGFPQSKPNLYNNGSTVGNTLNFCNDNGVGYYSFEWYRTTMYNGNQDTYFSFDNNYVNARNFSVGGVTIVSLYANSTQNNFKNDGFGLYTLNESATDYTLFTSLTGWVNNEGHYEPSYEIGNNYGTVPSAVISSNDMTTYYNITYTDNSQGSHNTVWYPPNYDPTSNSYDPDTHTLKFDGVASFLSSLGELIGSLINGIASGIANIINSLITVVNNLKGNLLQGVIFDFLSAFMGWLPVEIVTLLTALFAITVIFALIKLLKGFF